MCVIIDCVVLLCGGCGCGGEFGKFCGFGSWGNWWGGDCFYGDVE